MALRINKYTLTFDEAYVWCFVNAGVLALFIRDDSFTKILGSENVSYAIVEFLTGLPARQLPKFYEKIRQMQIFEVDKNQILFEKLCNHLDNSMVSYKRLLTSSNSELSNIENRSMEIFYQQINLIKYYEEHTENKLQHTVAILKGHLEVLPKKSSFTFFSSNDLASVYKTALAMLA